MLYFVLVVVRIFLCLPSGCKKEEETGFHSGLALID